MKYFVALLFILLSPLNQSQAETTLTVANNLVANAHFSEASALYEQLIADGVNDATVFYNLGVSHYAQDDLGRALANFERARLLAPRDPDIQHNIDIIRDQLPPPVTSTETASPESWLAYVTNWVSLTELAWLALILWVLWVALLLIYRRPRRERQRTALQSTLLLLSLLMLVVIGLFAGNLLLVQWQPAALIVMETAVYTAPATTSASSFSLPIGTDVRIMQSNEVWHQVRLVGSDLSGWISAETAIKLHP